MSTAEKCIVGLICGTLFALVLFVEPPKWMGRLMAYLADWIEGVARAVFYRGRHHTRARLLVRPFDERPRPTVAQIQARIRREVKLVRVGTGYIAIDVDARGHDESVARALAAIA